VNKADHFNEAEIVLGTESRGQAEAELKNVGPSAWLRRSPNSSNGERFPIGSAFALKAPVLFRILWRRSFGSVAQVFWNTRQYMQRSIRESRRIKFMYSAPSSIDRNCDAEEKALRAR
jgi:hypothetical protein